MGVDGCAKDDFSAGSTRHISDRNGAHAAMGTDEWPESADAVHTMTRSVVETDGTPSGAHW